MGACVCVAMLGPPAAALHRPNAVLRCLCYTPDVKLSGFLPDRRVVQLLRRKSVHESRACPPARPEQHSLGSSPFASVLQPLARNFVMKEAARARRR